MTALVIALRTRTFRSLRRHRNYRIFFGGQLVSLAGTWMQNVALAWLVLELSELGARRRRARVLALRARSRCSGWSPASLADRFDSRRLVMATQARRDGRLDRARDRHAHRTRRRCPSSTCSRRSAGSRSPSTRPGGSRSRTRWSGRASLPNAVALNAGPLQRLARHRPGDRGRRSSRPSGTGVCFVAQRRQLPRRARRARDASGPRSCSPSSATRRRGSSTGLRRALGFVRHDPQLRLVLGVVTIVSTVGFNFHVLVPLLASDTMHVGPEGFGLLSAAFGLGALVGALVDRDVPRRRAGGCSPPARRPSACSPSRSRRCRTRSRGRAALRDRHRVHALHRERERARPARRARHLRGRLIGLYLFAFVGLAPVGGLLAGWLAELGGTSLAFVVAGRHLARRDRASRAARPRAP